MTIKKFFALTTSLSIILIGVCALAIGQLLGGMIAIILGTISLIGFNKLLPK